jgi:hypothetical protein
VRLAVGVVAVGVKLGLGGFCGFAA